VVIFGLGGILWLRHALRGVPSEVESGVPTRQPAHFQPTPHAQRGQAGARVDSADTLDAPAGAPGPHGEGGTGVHASSAIKGKPAPGADQRTSAAASNHEAAADADATGEATPQQVRKAATGTSSSLSFNPSAVADNQTAPIIAQGIEIDPTTGAARFSAGAQLAYPDRGGINFDQGSVAFWVRREGDPNAEFDNRMLAELRTNAWENRFELNMAQRFLGLVVTNSDGVQETVSYTSMQWTPGIWHYVTVTWGEAIMQLYVDGELVDQEAYLGTVVIPDGTPLYVGSRRGAPGTEQQHQPTISMLPWSVFPNMLSPDEVAALMVQTAPPS
jgi:hypothetical protein